VLLNKIQKKEYWIDMAEDILYEQQAGGDPEPLKKLYDVVSEKGMYTKSYDDFKSKYSKPEERDKLFNAVAQEGLYTKSKDEFNKKYFDGGLGSVPKFELPTKPIKEAASKESTGITPTAVALQQAKSLKNVKTSADKFSEQVAASKKVLESELKSNEDVIEKSIREGRYLQAKEQGLTEFAAGTRSDMPQTQAQIDARRLIEPGVKPQDLPVTKEELALKRSEIESNEAQARQHIADTAKYKPEKKAEIEKAAYLADKATEIEQTPDSPRVNKFLVNAAKIGKGYAYDVKTGRLIRPEGFLDSIITGIKERTKQIGGYNDVKNMTDEQAAAYFDRKKSAIDPDEAVPVPTGAGEIGQMTGQEWAPLLKGAGAAIVSTFAGNPEAAPFVNAAINAPEYYKRSYYSAFEETYNQLKAEGKPPEEAIRIAREQAEVEGKLGAVEGAVSSIIGARIGLKPLPKFNLTGGLKKAVTNVLGKTAHYGGEAALEGTVDGLVAGYLQEQKNISAKEKGIFRTEGKDILENIKGELVFSLSMAGVTGLGKAAVDPNTYKTLLYHLTKQPEAAIDERLGEWVQEGRITEEDAKATKEAIKEEKKVQAQIPENVTEEAREKIRDKIDKRNELVEKADQLDDAFKPALKEKINTINEEIVELSNDTQKPTEEQKIIISAIKSGKIPGVLKEVAKDNPESFFKMIADQAFGRTETGEMSAEPNAEQATRDQFGDEIVDKAKELYPMADDDSRQGAQANAEAMMATDSEGSSQQQSEEEDKWANAQRNPEAARELRKLGYERIDIQKMTPDYADQLVEEQLPREMNGRFAKEKEVVINTPEDLEAELTRALAEEAPVQEEVQVKQIEAPPVKQKSVSNEKKAKPVLDKKEQDIADYAYNNTYRFFKQKYPDIDVDEYNRLRSVKRQQGLPKLGEINQENNARNRNEDTTQYTPQSIIQKAREFYKNDPLINRVLSFLEPIIKANPNIKIDTSFKWDSPQYEGQKITKQALGYSFPSGNLILNFDRISDYDTLYRTALHEMVHAATRNEINTNKAFNDDLKKVLTDVRRAMKLPEGDSVVDALIRNQIISEDYDARYGAANEHELLAEVFTNQKFFEFLKGLEYKGDNMLHRLFLAIAKFFSQKYNALVNAKGNISVDNIADYLMGLTESVVSGQQEQTEGGALPLIRPAMREVLKNIVSKSIGKISGTDIRAKLKQIAGLTDQEVDDLLSEVTPPQPAAQPDRVLTQEEIGGTPAEPKRKSGFSRFREKYFDRAKGLPDWILKLKDRARGNVHLEVRQALQLVDKVRKTAKQLGFNDWELFDKALRGQYYGSDFADLKSLPPEMQVLNVQMRNKIDSLSRDLIINNYVTPEQALNIESNIGEYMTRSYRAFNEKDWGKKVPQAARDDAYRLLTQQRFNELLVDRKEDIEAGNVTEDELIEDAKGEAFVDLQSIIDGISDKYTPTKSNVEKGKDLGVLKQRLNIPKEIREVLGEYTDPGVNFAMTIARIASLKSTSEYLNSIKNEGMGEIFFEADSRPPSASVQIAAEGSETWNPLNGLYTTPEIKEIFKESEATRNKWVQRWLNVVGAIKWGKTVGSLVTQVKNFESNLGFAIMNGHYRAGKSGQSFKFLKDKLFNGEKSQDAMIEKVVRLGIVDQSVGVRELKDMFATDNLDKVIIDASIKQQSPLKQLAKTMVGKPIKYLNKVYTASDDFWKVYGFLNEAESLSQATHGKPYKELTEDEQSAIDAEASERVKNTYPTYDRVWEGAKTLSKGLPIFGNFLSFQAESIRVLLNTFDYAIKDLKTPGRQLIGAQRIAGIGAYLSARTMILYAIAQMTGVGMAGLLGLASDDEEDQKLKDINRYSPDFIRSGDKMAIDHGDGKYTVYDVGGLEPYGIWFKTMNAFNEGNDIVKDGGIAASATELLSPFVEPEMSFKIGMNLYNNENDFGGRIYNPLDNAGDKMLDAMGFVIKKAKPSTIDFIQKVYSKENKQNEISAMFGGRGYDIETVKGFSFKLKAAEELFDANRDALNKAKYGGKATEEEIAEAQTKFEERTNKIIKMLSEDYQAAIRLGAKIESLDEVLDRKKFFQGYNKNVKNQIKSGAVDTAPVSDEIKEWQP
jgi:hypothetical protein